LYAERKLVANARTSGNDVLLAAAVRTKTGRKCMPECAKAFGMQEHFREMCDNTKALLGKCGGRHKHEVAHLMIHGLPKSFCNLTLGMSDAERKSAMRNTKTKPDRLLGAQQYAEGMDRKSRNILCEGEEIAMTTFFNRTTHQCSGADNSRARIMDTEYYEWEAQLHAQWPGILRELVALRPDLVPDLAEIPKTGWTKFQANLLSALHYCPSDPMQERTDRHAESLAQYRTTLAKKSGSLPMNTAEENASLRETKRDRAASRRTFAAFKPDAHVITSPSLEAFRAWLKVAGHRYTRFTVPHPCPLCTDGPTNEIVHAALTKQMIQMVVDKEEVPYELTQRITKLRAQLRVYRVHVLQLLECRAAVQKAEDELAPGTAMIIRDFVNHHDHGGKHVKCLHWVLMWRDEVGEPLKRLKLRHYCSDKHSMSTDSYFQADVTDFHLNEDNPHCPGLMKKFTEIIFVGDHGPHFASHETMHNESTILRKYGKIIRLMFLASYHAYSRADGSGAEDSTDLKRDLIAGFPRFGARAMTDMTNSSHDLCSWAWEFPAINRSLDVFPPGKHFQTKYRAKWIKKWTEVEFNQPDKSGLYDGLLQYRLVTGQGDWQWTDLVASTRGPANTLCDRCSTKANSVVLHTHRNCPSPGYIHDLPVYKDLQPDPARIHGEQVAGKNNGKKTKGYPCKYVDCPAHTNKRKAFRNAHNANRHMKLTHSPTDAEYTELAYPDADEEAVDPSTAKDKGNRAPKKKPKSKPKTKTKPKSKPKKKPNKSSEEDEPTSASEAETSASSSGDDENDDEKNDPDEEVEVPKNTFVVERIHGHRLLASGKHSYDVQWVGYKSRTWEKEHHLQKSCRIEYHSDLAKKTAADVANQAAAAAVRRGGRARRGSGAQDNQPVHLSQRLVLRAHSLVAATGMSYYKAYEQAQAELGFV
jgi:hypothetical protein